MLMGRSFYSGSESGAALAPFDLRRVSAPSDARPGPSLETCGIEDVSRFLEADGQQLRSDGDLVGSIEPYWDPKLRHSKRAYISY